MVTEKEFNELAARLEEEQERREELEAAAVILGVSFLGALAIIVAGIICGGL